MILHLYLVLALGSIVHADFIPQVSIRTGRIQGKFDHTVGQGIAYSSFRGIPYAKPPVGDLRFKPPQKIEHITKPLAVNDHHVCSQYSVDLQQVIGSEDCLYLNVYTPNTNFGSNMQANKAVMVWIHGGAFMWGSKKKSNFGPDFLIEKDVVVVAMNYRLGAFGFLAVGKKISGNMGLKDQVMALEWVRDNIAYFGGDPNRVTIFGESAGAVSVELHRLSPKSRGLFRASIAMSGSPLNPWAFASTADSHEMSKEFIKAWSEDWGNSRSEHMEFSFTDAFLDELVDFVRVHDEDEPTRKEIYRKLKTASAELIARTTQQLMNSQVTIPFLPTIEPSSLSHAFITESPENILQSKECNLVPHILGYTHDEFIGIAPIFKNMYQKLSGLKSIVEATASFTFFEAGIDKTREYLKKNCPNIPVWTYVNVFDYPQSLHKVAGLNEPGCGHADDLAHIFYVSNKNQPLDNSSSIARHRNKMTGLWTNFAKYLYPTPKMRHGWFSSTLHGYRMKINDPNVIEMELLPGTTLEEADEALREYINELDL